MNRLGRVAIGIGLLFAVHEVQAQSPRGIFGLGLNIGGSVLNGDVGRSNTGLTGGLTARLSPTSFLSFTGKASYGATRSGLNSVKTELGAASLTTTLYLLPEMRISPFLSFGAAAFHFVARDSDGQILSRSDGSAILGWERALQMGVGLEFFVADKWAVTTSADYFMTQGDDLDAIHQGTNDTFFRGLLGFMYYFKSSEPAAKSAEEQRFTDAWESMLESHEVKTVEASPATTPQPKEVAEDDDFDLDDLLAEPEPNETQSVSETPVVPETPSESRSAGSGIAGAAGTRADYEAKAPEPAAEQKAAGSSQSAGIFFQPGTARILEKSRAYLDQIYQYLKNNPDEIIELVGFQGDTGDRERDMRLAIARAKAVKTYLVNKGIAPRRIILATAPNR